VLLSCTKNGVSQTPFVVSVLRSLIVLCFLAALHLLIFYDKNGICSSTRYPNNRSTCSEEVDIFSYLFIIADSNNFEAT
jgi:hypothetical protein